MYWHLSSGVRRQKKGEKRVCFADALMCGRYPKLDGYNILGSMSLSKMGNTSW